MQIINFFVSLQIFFRKQRHCFCYTLLLFHSVLCIEPFEGAEDNLRRSIVNHIICTDENNSVHHCVSRLFSLLRLWDQENPNSDQINQECQVLVSACVYCF